MSQNLLDLVQSYFGGDTVRQASTALGESESGVGTALRSIVPLALGGLFARSQQSGGAAELFGMAQEAHGSGVLGNLGSLLGGGSSGNAAAPTGLLHRGSEMLRGVLGSQYAPAVEGIGQQAGVSASTAGSLLSMATPVVLGLLGRHAADNNLDANGFGSYLSSQGSSITGALGSLPGGLGSMLSGLGLGSAAAGLGSMAGGLGNAASTATAGLGNAAAATATRTGDALRSTTREVEAAAATPSRWPWLLLLLLGLGALFYFLRGRNEAPAPAAATAAPAAADTTRRAPPAAAPAGRFDQASGNYIYDTGTSTALKLPDGTVLNAGANSVEARLFNFLNDAGQTVGTDKTQGWMSLDRVYFNTSKSTLTAESQAQLKNVAAILKAFPNAAIKLGGYTDNQGAAALNQKLSAQRAAAAMLAVVGNGVGAAQLAAEGYGAEHPIASNDTPEGRAQNRRVDVRVTKK